MNEQFILGLLLGFLVGDELLRGSRWLVRWIRARNQQPYRVDGTRGSLLVNGPARRRPPEGSDNE